MTAADDQGCSIRSSRPLGAFAWPCGGGGWGPPGLLSPSDARVRLPTCSASPTASPRLCCCPWPIRTGPISPRWPGAPLRRLPGSTAGATTNAHPRDGRSLLAAGPGVTVEVDIAAPPARVWELGSDINLPARFSTEFLGGTWIDTESPRVGAAFVGRNRQEGGREWQTTSYIAAW